MVLVRSTTSVVAEYVSRLHEPLIPQPLVQRAAPLRRKAELTVLNIGQALA